MRVVARSRLLGLCLASLVASCHGCGSTDAPSAPPTVDATLDDTGMDTLPPRADTHRDTHDSAPLPDVGEGWSPVRGGEDCGLYEADLTKIAFAPYAFTECGPGCRVANAVTAGYLPMVSWESSAAASRGDVVVRAVMGSAAGSGASELARVTRVSDGVTLAAVQQRTNFSSCLLLGAQATPDILAYDVFRGAVDGAFVGRAGDSTGPIAWQNEWIPLGARASAGFEFSGGFGWTLLDGRVQVVTRRDAAVFTTVATAPDQSFDAMGRDDVVVFSAFDGAVGYDVIWGWSPRWAARRLVAHDANAHIIALSDDRLVWLGTHGPRAGDGTYAAVELYWSPLPRTPDDVVITKGPSLPFTHGVLNISAGPDHAAMVACDDVGATAKESCFLLVVQISTGHVVRLENRARTIAGAGVWSKVLGVTDREIVVTERDWPQTAENKFEMPRMFRLDVTKLDALAATL